MSYTQTTNLELYKDNTDEPIKNLRVHNNSNMDTLDTQIKALQDVIVNAKALLGQLGVDANGDPLIDDAAARAVLNAAADGTSGDESLYSVNQQAAENAVAIASLQDSVVGYSDEVYSNVAITTRSSNGAYYGRIDIPNALVGKAFLAFTVLQWTGAAASFTLALWNSSELSITSDESMTITSVRIRFVYIV